ncbi:MAG: hypothetical protein QOI36_6635 [Pseudonocardiales bacterium]|nr:hypothetical protein [Pseudonocardiales bacterium]
MAPFERDLLLIGHGPTGCPCPGRWIWSRSELRAGPRSSCVGDETSGRSALLPDRPAEPGPHSDLEPRTNRDRPAGDLAAARRYLHPAVVPGPCMVAEFSSPTGPPPVTSDCYPVS